MTQSKLEHLQAVTKISRERLIPDIQKAAYRRCADRAGKGHTTADIPVENWLKPVIREYLESEGLTVLNERLRDVDGTQYLRVSWEATEEKTDDN